MKGESEKRVDQAATAEAKELQSTETIGAVPAS